MFVEQPSGFKVCELDSANRFTESSMEALTVQCSEGWIPSFLPSSLLAGSFAQYGVPVRPPASEGINGDKAAPFNVSNGPLATATQLGDIAA